MRKEARAHIHTQKKREGHKKTIYWTWCNAVNDTEHRFPSFWEYSSPFANSESRKKENRFSLAWTTEKKKVSAVLSSFQFWPVHFSFIFNVDPPALRLKTPLHAAMAQKKKRYFYTAWHKQVSIKRGDAQLRLCKALSRKKKKAERKGEKKRDSSYANGNGRKKKA